MSLGFENAGDEIIAAYEYWDSAIECYRLNFVHPVIKMDLSDTENAISDIGSRNPDMIIGGPPCQDFSSAGKRIESDRADLTKCYAEIVTSVRPRYFVMENVARATSSKAYGVAREIFKNAGYGLTENVLDASYCGVPQLRKRFVCIGVLGAEDGVLNPYIQRNMSKERLTMRQYFGDSLDFEYYYRHPRNYSRRGIFSIDEPAPTIRGVNRPVPAGYPGNPNDACPINENIKPLTTLERSMVQTFPPTFKWVGSKTDKEQMIGNAVPVNLARFIATCINQYDSERHMSDIEKDAVGLENWLMESKGYSPRSAKDVTSRLKRAQGIMPFGNGCDEYLFRLEHEARFHGMSASVKSQIRNAVRLRYEYIDTNNN